MEADDVARTASVSGALSSLSLDDDDEWDEDRVCAHNLVVFREARQTTRARADAREWFYWRNKMLRGLSYAGLVNLARDGHDFNAHSGCQDETGLTALSYVANQLPRLAHYRERRTLELLTWLQAHGASLRTRSAFGDEDTLAMLHRLAAAEPNGTIHQRYQRLAAVLASDPSQ